MHTFLLAVVLLTIIGLFWQRWTQLNNDAEPGPANITFSEWAKHTVIEFILDVLVFTGYCFGINIGIGEKVATQVSGDLPPELLTISAAIATGLLIYKTVQVTILPIWNGITGAVTARKLLRNKVEVAVAESTAQARKK